MIEEVWNNRGKQGSTELTGFVKRRWRNRRLRRAIPAAWWQKRCGRVGEEEEGLGGVI